jgi:hypothetical protein
VVGVPGGGARGDVEGDEFGLAVLAVCVAGKPTTTEVPGAIGALWPIPLAVTVPEVGA